MNCPKCFDNGNEVRLIECLPASVSSYMCPECVVEYYLTEYGLMTMEQWSLLKGGNYE